MLKRPRRAALAKKASAKKKLPPKIVHAETRPFIDHLVIDRGFLKSHKMEEVLEILDAHGWSQLYTSTCTLNTDLAIQFFSTLVISGEDTMMLG